MTNLVKEVHGFFEEERLMNESSGSEYCVNKRKCNNYHYTDEAGFKGILTNCRLWLTHSKELNDLSEGKLVLQKIKEKLKADNSELLERIENSIFAKLEQFYSCSFSSYGNLLSQWRGYGDIAVGFNWDSLQYQKVPTMIIDDSGKQLTTSGLNFVQCNYVDPSNQVEVEPLVNYIVKRLLETFNNRMPALHEIQYCALNIGDSITSVKHIGFIEEQEYRIVHYWWQVNSIKDKHTNKSRVEYKFDADSVKRIVIGPCKDQDEKIALVKQTLEELGTAYNHVEIYRSMIPFIK